MAREIVRRVMFSFDKLYGRVKVLQLQPDPFDARGRFALRLLHHVFQGLRVNEVSKVASLKKDFESSASKMHGNRFTFKLIILHFSLV